MLTVNIVSVNLSGHLVFLAKAVRPRTWLEKRCARQSALLTPMIWAACLAALTVIVVHRP